MVKVKSILEVKEKDYMDMDKTIFQDEDNQVVYTYAKVTEGEEYDGEVTKDKAGNLKFKKTPKPFGGGGFAKGGTKEFKADPVKNASIERQVALKAAVDVVSAKLPLMDKLPETKDIATAVELLAQSFDKFLKGAVPVVQKTEKPKDEVKEMLSGAEEVNIDDIPFGDDE